MTINLILWEISITIKPNPNEDLEDPFQSNISIAPKVNKLDDDNEEDNGLAQDTVPVNNNKAELLLITNIATPSTPDIIPFETVDLNWEMEDIEYINQNDADYDNMVVTEH